jgi:NAD(P)-dependent dehydrogenase (short-subunit alcohol dehydrogenase family)
MQLKDKLAVITGGNSGIGYATAELFVKEGAKVVIAGRDLDRLKAAEKKLGSNVISVQADVTRLDALENLYKAAKQHFNQNIDIVVANAGVSWQVFLKDATEKDFDDITSANIKGVFFTVQKALPYLNSGASIVLVASLAAKQGVKTHSIYCASKAAVVSLAQSFAAELVTENIRVNSISPGLTKTPIFDNMPAEDAAQWTNNVPLKRMATMNEIATGILFLASDASSYMTGADLAIDGGVSGICPL